MAVALYCEDLTNSQTFTGADGDGPGELRHALRGLEPHTQIGAIIETGAGHSNEGFAEARRGR